MKEKLKSFFIPQDLNCSLNFAMFIIRVVAGSAMAIHGWGKIQSPMTWMGPEAPVPGFLQFLAALSEFGGGLAWIVGLFTPLASLGMFCTMTVAVYFHAGINGDPFVSAKGGPSFELAALYLCISLVLMFGGVGKFSADAKIFKK